MPAERIARHVIEDEILRFTRATAACRVWIVQMRAIRGAVAGNDECGSRRPGLDFSSRGLQCAGAGGTSLRDGGSAHVGRTDQSHEPWQTVEVSRLRPGHPENAKIEYRWIDVASCHFVLRHVRRKTQAMQARQCALPPCKGG